MRRFVAVASYEVRRLVRDRALLVLLVLLSCFGCYAGWNGANWVKERETAIELVRNQEQLAMVKRRQFVAQSYPSVILPSIQPVLRPGAMGVISVGQAEAYPYVAEVSPLGDYSDLFRGGWADIANPDVRAAGPFDLAFVIVFLLPLVILATSYDLWSRERESGVAALILSQPVTIAELIAAKVLARGGVVLLPSTVMLLSVSILAGARDMMGLLALAFVVLAYGCFWLAISVLINLVISRSTAAAIASGVAWLVMVVMAPSLALAAVDLAMPAPARLSFATELKAQKSAMTEVQHHYRDSHSTPERKPGSRIPDRLRDLYANRVAQDKGIAPLIAAHRRAESERRHALDWVRLWLPSVAVQDALDRIAGSDADRALAFEKQAREAQLHLRHRYKDYLDRDTVVTLAEYDAVPSFYFREATEVFADKTLADLASVLTATALILLAARTLCGRAATP